jgi:hypothetical protein
MSFFDVSMRADAWGSGGVERAVVHLEAPREEPGEFSTVSDDYQHILLLLVQLKEEFRDGVSIGAIQISRRFIGQEQGRFENERSCNRHALPFTSGEFRGTMAEAIPESDAIEQLAGERFCFGGLRRLIHESRYQDILEYRTLWQEVMILKHEADLCVPECRQSRLREGKWLGSIECHLAAGRAIECAKDMKERALAGSGRPHHGGRFAAPECERNAAQHHESAAPGRVLLGNVIDDE